MIEPKNNPATDPLPPALDLPDDATYLGDPETVDAILRTALADAIAQRTAVAEGRADVDLEQWLKDRVAVGVDVLLGKTNDATKMSDEWNAPNGGIVEAVRKAYGLTEGTPEEVMAVPFYTLVQTFMAVEKAAAEGEDLTHLIDIDMERAVAVLVGMGDVYDSLS